jgi:23S rRNA (adenine2030-N6)-methyltransferase
MNYRHAYHAGNFADVFKHLVILALTEAMLRKDKAFCYLDTHAGAGIYDLRAAAPQKSQEYEAGVAKLLAQPNPPALVKKYLEVIAKLNNGANEIKLYPGSPYFVKNLLRKQDRMLLTELHEEEYDLLKKSFPHYKQIGIHHLDGYQALKAFLPPPERRGFVLIDPPYEQPDELMQLVTTLTTACKRWETGIFAVWYPIKESRSIDRFHDALRQRVDRPMLAVELSIYPAALTTHLNGCGMVIINPPYQLDSEINTFLPWLWEALSPAKHGRYDIGMLSA